MTALVVEPKLYDASVAYAAPPKVSAPPLNGLFVAPVPTIAAFCAPIESTTMEPLNVDGTPFDGLITAFADN